MPRRLRPCSVRPSLHDHRRDLGQRVARLALLDHEARALERLTGPAVARPLPGAAADERRLRQQAEPYPAPQRVLRDTARGVAHFVWRGPLLVHGRLTYAKTVFDD